MSPDILVSIIIVTYNSRRFINDCIRSCKKSVGVAVEIIVFDNDSSDQTVAHIKEEFSDVHIYENRENIGYGKAVNTGFSLTSGDFILILNPDTVLDPTCIRNLVEQCKNRTVGIATPRLYWDQEKRLIQPTCAEIPTCLELLLKNIPILRIKHLENHRTKREYPLWDRLSDREVAIVTGAAMLLRKDTFADVGGFDSKYFMYFEDVDLSRRILHRGLKNVFVANAVAVHLSGKCTPKNLKYRLIFLESMEQYINQYHGKIKGLLIGKLSKLIAYFIFGLRSFRKILFPRLSF